MGKDVLSKGSAHFGSPSLLHSQHLMEYPGQCQSVILQHYNFPFQFVIVLDHPLFTKYKPVCLGSQSCCCLFTHVVHQGQTRAADSSNLRKTLFEENPTNSSGRECSVIDNRLAEDKNPSQSNLSSVTTLILFIRLNQTKPTNRTNHLPTSFSKVSKVK